jgi:membrane protein involved in colicin uptake
MPRSAVRLVAGLLGLLAASAFAMGVVNAPQRGRLPGEKTADEKGTSAPLQAADATPLSQERIEGPPPPPELTPEEKAKLEAEKKAKAEAEAARKAQAEAPPADTAAPATPAPPIGDRVGDLLDGVAPPPADDPPH